MSSRTAAKTAVPSRSPSYSSPRLRAMRSGTAHAHSRPSAAPLPPIASGVGSTATASAMPPIPHSTKRASDHERPVAALEQPAEDRDGGDRGQLVPDARVQEGRGRHPPPLAVDRPRDADVDQRDREEQQVAEQREDDERDRRVGPRGDVAADAGDLAGAEARQPRRGGLAGLASLARLGDGAVALDLRRALAQPVAAVRTLGDVGADLVAAVLADDVEIGHLCHCCPDSRPARAYALNRRCPRPMNECGGTPSRRLPVREPSRAQRAVLRASRARAQGPRPPSPCPAGCPRPPARCPPRPR